MQVYIGFSVDMDRAYSDYNCHGNKIPITHKQFDKYQTLKKDFIELTNKLFDYYDINNYSQSVTWYVNEADYHLSLYYDDILKKCCKKGELGLHTHLNSKKFNAESYNMSSNKNDWEITGLIEPNNKINKYLNYNNFIYKAGNHIRCNELFDALSDNGFSIDTTMDINNKNFENGHLFYDDTNIIIGSEPFFIKCNNGNSILEIPEIRVDKVISHIKECEKLDNLCFIKLQIHHWQYDELIPQFDKLFAQIKLKYDMEFVDLRTMQKLYFKKILDNLNTYLLNKISDLLLNDTYYRSLKTVISKDFLELSIWLFNNVDKRSKIIELFAGIGQCSLFLYELGFSNLTISDFDSNRCNFYKQLHYNRNTNTICRDCNLDYNNINSLVSDYYHVNLNNYDVVFFGNAINSSLCDKLDVQINKYQEYLDANKLLIIHKKYGSGVKEFTYLLDNLKNYNIIKSFNDYLVLKIKDPKKNLLRSVSPFSDKFKTYNTIAFDNITDTIIIDNSNNQEIIQLQFSQDIASSSGIYFPLFYVFPNIEEQIHKCKLSFDIKLEIPNENSKIKIFTGIKWSTINTELTNDFQTIEFIDDFDFFKPSTYRIGFCNIENNNLYLKNIVIKK